MKDDNIITLSESEWGKHWTMTIDIREIASYAGKRERDLYDGTWYTEYPIPRAKKLIKFILDHGTEEDFQKCEKYFKKNKKLYDAWCREIDRRNKV